MYELHITMMGNPDNIKEKVEELGWHFSKIDGDPDLGQGIKCYATKPLINLDTIDVINYINSVGKRLEELGCNVIRKKIEDIIYDTKETI